LNNIKESRAVKTIGRVWELFGPRGDERNGRREDWLAYMKLMDKTSNIISYRANRFNNLFSGAEAIIEHRDILSFVDDYVNQPNEKLKSIVSDLQCEYIITQIRSLAIISNIVTAPLWSIFNNTTVHHLDLHQYFQPLKNHLALCSTKGLTLYLHLRHQYFQIIQTKQATSGMKEQRHAKRHFKLYVVLYLMLSHGSYLTI
jgi:hypothetical protein